MKWYWRRKHNKWRPMAQSCADWTRTNKAAVDRFRTSLSGYLEHKDDTDIRIVRLMLIKLAEHAEMTLASVSARIDNDAEAFDRIANDEGE